MSVRLLAVAFTAATIPLNLLVIHWSRQSTALWQETGRLWAETAFLRAGGQPNDPNPFPRFRIWGRR